MIRALPTVTTFLYDQLADPVLRNSATSLNARYGIDCQIVLDLQDISPKTTEINHLVARFNCPFDIGLSRKVREGFQDSFTSSLVFSYRDRQEANLFRTEIDAFKLEQGSSNINIMRPDIVLPNGKYSASDLKILDNFICDTRRVKYEPKCVGPSPVENYIHLEKWFSDVSRIVAMNTMWHRAPTDGYFAHRVEGGFLITRTKSDKTKIDFENDVVLVREYCASTNTLVYEGNAIPSSDSVEASIVFNHHPSVSQLVHTHDSRRFTRNDKVLSTHPSQAQALPYGEVELGYEMARLLTGRGGDLIILLEHGEVFTGSREIPVSASIDYWISFYS